MIQIEYIHSDGFDVTASPEDFKSLKNAILNFLVTPIDEITLMANTNFVPFNNSRIVSKLTIRKTKELMLVSMSETDGLLITGSIHTLEALTSYINFESKAEFPDHSHFEYYDGHPVIQPNAVPIVFTVAKGNGLAG